MREKKGVEVTCIHSMCVCVCVCVFCMCSYNDSQVTLPYASKFKAQKYIFCIVRIFNGSRSLPLELLDINELSYKTSSLPQPY